MDRSLISLDRMASFVRVAERNSLSAVARELGVGQSTITRHLSELEKALGVALLHRTTRRVTLTDEGRRFHQEARAILHRVEAAAESARRGGQAAAGIVRITSTAALGVRHVSPLLFGFQDRHPGIRIDLSLSDDRVNLVRENRDIALRCGTVADSAMKRRALGWSERMLVASRAYLEARGRPGRAADLGRHDMIRMLIIAGSDCIDLRDREGGRCVLPVEAPFLTDHGLAVREAIVAGRGIALAHRWLVDDLLAAGMVEIVLPEFRAPPMPLTLLIVPERSRVERVRLAIDHLAEGARTLPGVFPTEPEALRGG
ncbi:LysR substrate-binding domain-containing protein [Rhizosaccharibacter radicis]|uniref:LysR family transcriptional regulator n=1 Tax=Rhizosaccharibacter radicis TaxID=2782605 RepID=A0ABT1VX91_9PROT|nr:LysR family transcriptional regulator [Acetobacteraceae bacterium KSS12]